MNVLIDTIKLNIRTYCDYHGLSLKAYSQSCNLSPNQVYRFLDGNDIFIVTFDKIVKPLGYFLADQSAEVKAVYKELGWKRTLAMTSRQTAFVEKVIAGKKNVMLNKYVELIEGFGLELKVRNNITEPLFAKLAASYKPNELKALELKIEALEEQGIFDFNDEL